MNLLDDAIAAAGGEALWQSISSIDVHFRCGGIAMPIKGQPGALREVHATIDTRRPHVELHDLGTFDAAEPRPSGMARRMRWRTADVVHFAGYAIWGYLTAPFLFAYPGFGVLELPRRRLRVDFPSGIPTHSRRQTFHFDENAMLTRLDYTAEPVLGPLARAQHRCFDHRRFNGLLVPTRRRVTPRGLPAPLLVSIDIDELYAS